VNIWVEEREGNMRLKKNCTMRSFTELNNIMMTKSRTMRWAGHVALLGEKNAYSVLIKNLKEKDHLNT
jgi:hypothetical protein